MRQLLISLLSVLFVLLSVYSLHASHLIGGYMSYECLGNNSYRFTVKIVRDCFGNNAPYDGSINFTIYAGNNLNFPFQTVFAPLVPSNITTVPITANNPCLIPPANLCVQEAFYQVVVTLPFNASGYYVAHQRCCRNSTVNNIFNPGALGSVGNTFMIFLSAAAQTNQANGQCGNSSPVFEQLPPAVICLNQDINFNVGGTDADGDSLVYSLCAPYEGGSQFAPAPNPATPPPYNGVVFIGPLYSAANPLGTNPPMTINPQTGLISGIPSIPGQFVVGVCVSEYRNGVLLSQTRRDFQFNVTSCAQVVNAALESDETLIQPGGPNLYTLYTCGDTIIEFQDLSTDQNFINAWQWTFFKNGEFFKQDTTQNPVINFEEPGLYTGMLVVNPGTEDCTDSSSILVNIYPDMIPDFDFLYDSCAFVPVDFEDLSTPLGNNIITGWLWDFDDGFTSTLQNPSHFYDSLISGDFLVTLTITDNNGCTRDVSKTVEYYPSPIIAIDADTFQGCSPFFIQFSNNSYPIDGYSTLWVLGDGDSAFVASPAHTYQDPGYYSVIIEITSPVNGCVSKDTFIDLIKVEPIPFALFSTAMDTCEQLPVTFFESSIDTGLLPILTWYWDFGDGNDTLLTEALDVAYGYADAGIYTVSLTVADSIGCSSTFTEIIEYFPASAIAIEPSLTEGCSMLEVEFANFSFPVSGYDILWDFGDGNTSTDLSPVHFYTDTGIYTVVLTITSPSGCVSQQIFNDLIAVWPLPQPDFSIDYDTCSTLPVLFTSQSFNVGSGGPVNTWSWNFGDNNTASAPMTSHQYTEPGTYFPQLTVTDINGCTDSISYELVWYPAASISFSADETEGCEMLEVSFTHNAVPSTGYDFWWSFGNGSTSTAENPFHAYTSPGFYDVSLQIVSPAGCESELVAEDFIKVYNNPTAQFNYAFDTCTVTPVSFFDTSIPGDGTIVSWLYDFGDGNTSGLPVTTHLFDTAGFLTVSLTVADIFGCTDSTAIVTGWFPNPIITIVPDNTEGCEPLEVFFENNSYPINGYTTFWEFGDGGTSLEASPTYTYENPGIYTVILTITAPPGSPGNCVSVDTFIDLVNVNASGIINFDVVYDPCSSQIPIQFMDLSTAGSSPIYYWNWNFGDGNESVEPSPQHIYSEPGTYTVSLTLTDSIGCHRTYTDTLQYYPASLIDISWETDGNCTPLTASFFNHSQYYTDPEYTWTWQFSNGVSLSGSQPEHTFQSGGDIILTVTSISPSGCTAQAVYDNLGINNPPTAAFQVSWDSCALDPIQLTDQSIPGGLALTDWIWSFGDGFQSNLQSPFHTFTSPGVYDIQLIVRDNNGCYDTSHIRTLSYFPAPLIDLEPDRWFDCADATITFTNWSQPIDENYSAFWQFGDGNSASFHEGEHTYTQAGEFPLTLTMTSPTGCTSSRTLETPLNIAPHFIAEIAIDPDPFTQLDKTVTVTALPESIAVYEWFLNQQFITFAPDFDFDPEQSSQITLGLYATHPYGCTDTVQRIIVLEPTLRYYLPNAFSPDENGNNDLYFGVGSLLGIHSFSMEIFNRWGERVFFSTQPEVGWNGRKNNTGHKILSQGNYVCIVRIVDAQGKQHTFTENIMLLR